MLSDYEPLVVSTVHAIDLPDLAGEWGCKMTSSSSAEMCMVQYITAMQGCRRIQSTSKETK